MAILDSRVRTDGAPKRPGESKYAFLNRCSATYFEPVRELLETWLAGFPIEHRGDLLGRLTDGDDHRFEGAFWEMYLHQLATANGAQVVVHPNVPGTPNHPDFLVHDVVPYYLEAVAVGEKSKTKARDSRLAAVEAVIDEARATGIKLRFNWYAIGDAPVKAAKLKRDLIQFVGLLDPVVLEEQFNGGLALPQFQFDEDGWSLEFTAIPAGRPGGRLISITGAGRAGGVDNGTGLRRVLDRKANRYGTDLDHPLVTAALSNTEVPTKPYEFRNVLYGEHALSPLDVGSHESLYADGHWRTRKGWRRSHNPHVVTGSRLTLYNLATVAPRIWSTVEPGAYRLAGLAWADPVDVSGPEPSPATMVPDVKALGVTEDWCIGDPDYDLR